MTQFIGRRGAKAQRDSKTWTLFSAALRLCGTFFDLQEGHDHG